MRKTKSAPKKVKEEGMLSVGMKKTPEGWVLYRVKSFTDAPAEHDQITQPDYRDFTHLAMKQEIIKNMIADKGPWVDGKWKK